MHCRSAGRVTSVEVKGTMTPIKEYFPTSISEIVEAIRQGVDYILICVMSLDTMEPMYMVFQGVADLLEDNTLSFMVYM